MNKCMLCGIETKGSVGAADIYWKSLCQSCKDKEDQAAQRSMDTLAKTMTFFDKMFYNHKEEVGN